ncbi:MAG: M48 family metalloprotease [Leptospiraceae bacterium]|nr:M48 family metalloprotease [Leptospiraceae bacterium]
MQIYFPQTRIIVYVLSVISFVFSCKSSGETKELPVDPAVKKEVEVGRALAGRLAKKYGMVQDEEFTRYINLIGKSMAAYSSRQELDFRFGVLNTEEVNAFACPGGYVMITRGSIEMMESEAELASILSHELSHVTLMHSGKFDEQGSSFLDILGSVMAPGGNLVSSLTKTAVDGMLDQFFESGRKKEQEIESDKAGIFLMAQAGYNTKAASNLLVKLDKSQHNETVLKTHPPTADRIKELENFIAENGLAKGGKDNKERFQEKLKAFESRNPKVETVETANPEAEKPAPKPEEKKVNTKGNKKP